MRGLDFSDARYVRLYTQDTPIWTSFSWNARSVYMALRRVCDRAGIIPMAADVSATRRIKMVAALLRAPEDVVADGLAELLEADWARETASCYVLPEFLESETASAGSRLRQEESRKGRAERAEAISRGLIRPNEGLADVVSPSVTAVHGASPDVTLCCAVPCLTEEKALRELTPPPPAPTSGKSRETSNPVPVQLNALLVPTGPKPAKARERRKGNPRHRPLLEALMQAFLETTGSAYALAREKDPPAVSALLELAPDEEILRRWRESLTHRNDFLRVSTIAQLRSKWNDLRPRYGMPVLVAQAGGTGSGFRPAS